VTVTQKVLRVGFTYDAKSDYKLGPGDSKDKYAEFDSDKTINEIYVALKSGGHEVIKIGHIKNLLTRLNNGERWDIVFNIAEGVCGRNRESQVPSILEVFDIPYMGSDALTMGLTLDKALAKTVLKYNNLSTPDFIEVSGISDLKKFNLKYPVIVKPSEEGTSKGIEQDAIAHDFKHVKERACWILENYKQPALVEEFIIGQEFTVALIGNDPPEALPPVQISIKGNTDLGEDFYTHERVENDDIRYICKEISDKKLEKSIISLAINAYKVLGCKDVGRMDIRVDKSLKPYFLECNPLPNLGEIDVFPILAKACNMTYNEIILKILNFARKRYNI
jgi:D-alanine-D-alanine ligase